MWSWVDLVCVLDDRNLHMLLLLGEKFRLSTYLLLQDGESVDMSKFVLELLELFVLTVRHELLEFFALVRAL